MAALIPWIEKILATDQKAPRKQRHTAHRIWCRVGAERSEVDVGESTVREYVRKRKIELGLEHGEVFVPQTYRWGQEGQVDWYEAYAEVDGEQVKAYVFCLRSMASGRAFHRAYPHASQQAFLEAHEWAFAYFGGVFGVLRFDNLKSAVMAWERETGAQRCRVPGQYGGGTPAASAARFNCTRVPAKPECWGENLPRPQRGAGWANGAPGGSGPGGGDRGSAPPRPAKETGDLGWRWLRR